MRSIIHFDKPKLGRRVSWAAALIAILTIAIYLAEPAPKKQPVRESAQPANSPWRQSPFG